MTFRNIEKPDKASIRTGCLGLIAAVVVIDASVGFFLWVIFH